MSLHNAKKRAFGRIFDLRTDSLVTEELEAGDDLEERVGGMLTRALDPKEQARAAQLRQRSMSVAHTLTKRVAMEREAEAAASKPTGDLFAQVMAHDRSQANVQRMIGQQHDMRRRVEAISVDPEIWEYGDEDGRRDARRSAAGSSSFVDEDEARVLIDAGAAARAAMVPCTCCERPYRARA